MDRVSTSYTALPQAGMQYPPNIANPANDSFDATALPYHLSGAAPVHTDPMRTPPHIHYMQPPIGVGGVHDDESMMTGSDEGHMDIDHSGGDIDDLTIAMRGLVEPKEPPRCASLFPLQCEVRTTWGEEKTAWLESPGELTSYLRHVVVENVEKMTIKLPGMGEWDFNAESPEGQKFVAVIKSFFRDDAELNRKFSLDFGYTRE